MPKSRNIQILCWKKRIYIENEPIDKEKRIDEEEIEIVSLKIGNEFEIFQDIDSHKCVPPSIFCV
jgi:hypothetical protein